MHNSSSSSSSSSSASSSGVPRGASEEDNYRLHCEEVLRRNPNHEEAVSHLALWHLERRNFSLARRYIQHLVTLKESDFDTWLLLSLCCSMDNLIDEAITCNRLAEASTKSINQTQKFKLQYMQILLLERNKEYDLAFSQYSALLQDVSEAIGYNQRKLEELMATSSSSSSSSSVNDDKNGSEYTGLSGQQLIEHIQSNLSCQLRIREEVLLREAIIYKETGVTEECRIICEKLLSEDISIECKNNVLCLRGMLYELKEDLKSAEKVYLEATQLQNFSPWASERLGRIYLKYGQTIPAALQFLFNSVKMNSVNSRTWYLLGRCYTASTKDNFGHDPCDYYSAFQAYTRAINLDPNDAKVWCSLGVLYYAFGQYKESLSHLAKAVKLDPSMPEAWYNIGALYEMCEQPEDAKQAYAKAKECGIKERFEKVGMKSNPPAIDLEQTQHEDLSSSSAFEEPPKAKNSTDANMASMTLDDHVVSTHMVSPTSNETSFHMQSHEGNGSISYADGNDVDTSFHFTPETDMFNTSQNHPDQKQTHGLLFDHMDSKEEELSMQIMN